MRTSDFKIVRLLGKGTYGAVYKVIRKSDKEEYAMKEVSIKDLKTREQEDAVNEIRVLASIKHRNILRYCDAFLEKKNLYIVTEYAKAGDLHRRIQKFKKAKKRMPEDLVWIFIHQMCAGLHSLHRMKILHRDLKPKNIFVTGPSGNKVMLGDLGCAKLMKNQMARTQIGTPYYMAPEIWNHKSYGPKADMWSLGCIIFEMCQFSPPFLAEDMAGLSRKVRHNACPRISSQYSTDLQALVKRLLSKDPRNRPSAADILAMDPLVKRHNLLPETPLENRWNHKHQHDYENHVKNGVLSTIKVPKNASRYRPLRINLPEAAYPIARNIAAELAQQHIANTNNTAITHSQEVHSSPIRGTKPVIENVKRPNSANGKVHRRPAQPSSRVSNGARPSHGRKYNKYDHIKAKVAGAQQPRNSRQQRYPCTKQQNTKQNQYQKASNVVGKENLPNVQAQYGGNYSRQQQPSVQNKLGGKRVGAAAPMNSNQSYAQHGNAQYGNNGRYSRYGQQYNNNRGGYFQNAPTRLW
jgi:NIMA (never in mitosis gene a)-related kinase 1/4/5